MLQSPLKTLHIEKFDRIFVIGDIHGHLKHTEKATEFIFGHSSKSKNNHVVFLGDYVDRGPDSKGVIDEVLKFKEGYEKQHGYVHFLRGNHEGMFMHFLGIGGMYGDAYTDMCNGGLATLKSYGISQDEIYSLGCEGIRNIVGEKHLQFLKDTIHYVTCKDFMFVHAGFNPRKKLEEQNEEDVTWIRDEWIKSQHSFKKFVIHGHTRVPAPSFDVGYKMNIDTMLQSRFLSMAIINSKRVADNRVEIQRIDA